MAQTGRSFATQCLDEVRSQSPWLRPGHRPVLALSGGADSVACLHLLMGWADDGLLKRPVAFHLDHGLRQTSKDDRLFCEDLCHRLKVPLFSLRLKTSRRRTDRRSLERLVLHMQYRLENLSAEHSLYISRPTGDGQAAGWLPDGLVKGGSSLEGRSRDWRYFILNFLLARLEDSFIVTGFHLDDWFEGAVMKLLRGSGWPALAPVRMFTVRPLMMQHRKDVRAFLSTRGADWCEDESNQSGEFLRNRLRLGLATLPPVSKASPYNLRSERYRFEEGLCAALVDFNLLPASFDFCLYGSLQQLFGAVLYARFDASALAAAWWLQGDRIELPCHLLSWLGSESSRFMLDQLCHALGLPALPAEAFRQLWQVILAPHRGRLFEFKGMQVSFGKSAGGPPDGLSLVARLTTALPFKPASRVEERRHDAARRLAEQGLELCAYSKKLVVWQGGLHRRLPVVLQALDISQCDRHFMLLARRSAGSAAGLYLSHIGRSFKDIVVP